MLSFNIIDRRLNPSGKSLSNRQRFLERVKKQIESSVSKGLKKRGVEDQSNAEVSISQDGIEEPQFQYDRHKGNWDYLLPGNKEYNVGDQIPRPEGGGGGGSKGSPDGDGQDEFRFYISYEEYINAILDDLSLPDMVKESEKHVTSYVLRRAGYTPVGTASNLALEKTMIQGLARRLALKTPKLNQIIELEALLENEEDEDRRHDIEEEITDLRTRAASISFLEKTDLRYHNTVRQLQPINQAVMFCVDGETEFLSPTGWKKISAYNEELVAQYNNGRMEFVKPNQYVKNPYDGGYFLRIKAQGIDQMLTPQHRVVYRTQSGNITEITAAELEERHNNSTFGFRGKFITHFTYSGSGLELSDNEIRFHVAWKADGTYQTDHGCRAQFYFHKQRKADRLVEILTELGWDYNYTQSEPGSNENVHRIYVTTPKRIGRRYGSEWYQINEKQLQIISNEVLHWDGYSVRETFTSQSKMDCDYIQFVWAADGYGTNLYQSNDEWVVGRCSYAERSLTSKTPNKITRSLSHPASYSYCFSVPSGMLILRRDNNIFVTGNCLMDVSGSMTEHMKDLAKRFYILLYVFLSRRYKDVSVVFIRHTHMAVEVDEDTFFHSPETGGTVISTAYEEMIRIIKERYPVADWNIYVAQASDGDNTESDNSVCHEMLSLVLPWLQYLTYIEVRNEHTTFGTSTDSKSDVWKMMETVNHTFPEKIAIRRIRNKSEIVDVFRSLFKKKDAVT